MKENKRENMKCSAYLMNTIKSHYFDVASHLFNLNIEKFYSESRITNSLRLFLIHNFFPILRKVDIYTNEG